jgi:hypothetical protein
MRGGVDPVKSESDTGNDESSMTKHASNVVSGIFNWISGNTQTPQQTAGRRRRRTKIKMRGGDFSPNSPFTNAMEVQHIQTAPPQTLVGGRRRRKSSRISRRRSSRRH